MDNLDALEAKMREYADRYDDLWQSKAADAIRELRAELTAVLKDPDWRECCDLRQQAEAERDSLRAERDDYKVQWQRDSTALGKTLNELSMKQAVIQDLRGELATLRRELAHNCTRETEISNERHELRASLAAVQRDLQDARHNIRERIDAALAARGDANG